MTKSRNTAKQVWFRYSMV